MNRRSALAGFGGIGLIAVGAGWWRVRRSDESARSAWMLDGARPVDIRLDAFRHAILAPNPHNRQPWLIKLVGTNEALIACDLDRRLPETDPFDRQIVIGFGTFIELAGIAATARGSRLEIYPFPEGEPQPRLDGRPVAQLAFMADAGITRDPLFAAITARHTNRQIYEPLSPTQGQLTAIRQEGVSASSGAALVDKLRAIVIGAMTTEMTLPRTWMESVNLMRIGAREIVDSPDGIAIGGPAIEAMSAAGIVTRNTLGDPTSAAFKSSLDDVPSIYGSLPAIAWITTAGNARVNQLDAGRRYLRAALRATLLDLSMHPMSQAIQEYPEMSSFFSRVATVCGVRADERVQMLARLGRASQVLPSPRWPLRTHLI